MRAGPTDPEFFQNIRRALYLTRTCLLLMAGMCVVFLYLVTLPDAPPQPEREARVLLSTSQSVEDELWRAPDSASVPLTKEGDIIRYGRELIAHTARYLGPRGEVMAISNGMNCQNCHLRAGTQPFGNNYAAVASTYPKFRARSGSLETMERRINDCIERSLNGRPLAVNSVEMRAIIAWFRWVGKDVRTGTVPRGTGITSLPLMKRAADPVKGMAVYRKHCEVCHGVQAQGYKHPDSAEWKYPPLAGSNSYNTGAGLYRLSRFAGYVKSNMPHGTTFEKPVLTDEEAWDVAAYVNSLPRPEKHFAGDWPDIAAKPFDHPFGPFADSFPEVQHKYGPFGDILAAKRK
jgi:thiosulfate dehydrogenase